MSLKYLYSCLIVLGALGAAPVQADCKPPVASAIPDGSTASGAEMLAAMKAFKQYDAEANAYLKCLETETQNQIAQRVIDRAELKGKQMEAHNAAVDELQAAAGRFNRQVRIYKDRSKS